MIKSLSKNIIDVKTFGLAVKTVKSYGQTVWERVKPTPVEFGGLKFTALEAGEIGMTHNGTNATTTKPSLSYSKNGGEWVEWDYTNIPVVKDDVVYFKGINDRISISPMDYSTLDSIYSTFTSTGKIAASGNIMSLLYGDDYEDKYDLSGKDYCFYNLFYNCSNLTTAPELPATKLAIGCYYSMLYGCTSLTTAPAIPATELSDNCYYSMFYGCTSLTTAQELPATTLAIGCYENMFNSCTSLTTAPELPATTLAIGCYYSMFNSCTSLTTAPELPATELVNNCYYSMFYGCTKLNYVKANFLTEPSSTYTASWLSGVASTGTFVANPEATWTDTVTRGSSTVPENWTIQK